MLKELIESSLKLLARLLLILEVPFQVFQRKPDFTAVNMRTPDSCRSALLCKQHPRRDKSSFPWDSKAVLSVLTDT